MAGKDGKWDRGSTILVEVEFKTQTPFGTLDLFDPSGTPTITVTDPDGTVRVAAAVLTKENVGQWYYRCQTEEDWPIGNYQVKTDATDGSYDDVTIEPRGFELV